jgi:hypothetical protein
VLAYDDGNLQLMDDLSTLTMCGERVASKDEHEDEHRFNQCCLLASHLAAGSVPRHA